MSREILAELGRASRERTPVVLRHNGARQSVLPLWPVAAGHGEIDVVALAWRPYRALRVAPAGWRFEPADNRPLHPAITVPPVDLSQRVRLQVFDPDIGRPVEDVRRIAEAAALAERFGLDVTIGYQPEGRAMEARELSRVVVRGECLVASDLRKQGARSFRFDRTQWIELTEGKAPRWVGTDYEASP